MYINVAHEYGFGELSKHQLMMMLLKCLFMVGPQGAGRWHDSATKWYLRCEIVYACADTWETNLLTALLLPQPARISSTSQHSQNVAVLNSVVIENN